MSDPIVSVVIIEFFSLDELEESINSIRSTLGGIEHEIIITSNSCYDTKTRESAIIKFPDVVFSFNEKNGGFAYGMNRGIEKAHGRFLVIANSDSVVQSGFSELISFLQNHPEIGAAGPQIINSEGIVQDSFRKYVSVPRFLIRHLKRMFRDIPVLESGIDQSLAQTVDWISGGFMAITRQAFEATNGLDEGYFLYAEDVDWCTRIRVAGYEIAYYPSMKVVFTGSRSARNLNKFTLVFIKSHLRFWFKFGFFSGYPERREIIFDE
jgi:N-acetylglucosaminyl-diphospho-decaprenol L-rhamnosyltransferase